MHSTEDELHTAESLDYSNSNISNITTECDPLNFDHNIGVPYADHGIVLVSIYIITNHLCSIS